MRQFFSLVFLSALLAFAALAADVTGKWTAQMPGRGGEMHEAIFNLKADGPNLTGTVSGPRGEMEISEGKIEGDQISFSQTLEFGGNEVKLLYHGTVAGDEIKFTRTRDGGQGHSQEFTAKRVH